MNSTNFASKKLKGRGLSSAPLMDNYNKSVNTKAEQKGRSMIEMLGVLAIIGVLSVGGIAGYSKAMMKYRINKTIEQITLVAGNIRSFFRGNYDGVDCSCNNTGCTGKTSNDGCPILKKAKIIPDEMLTMNSDGKISKISTALEYQFSIKYFPTGASRPIEKGDFVFFIYTQTDKDACIELLSQDWSTIGVKAIINDDTGVTRIPPLTIDDAIYLCNDYRNMFVFSK